MKKTILNDYFGTHPKVAAFHFTSDGMAFTNSSAAQSHQDDIDKKVEVKTVTRKEYLKAIADEKKDAEAKAEKEAKAQAKKEADEKAANKKAADAKAEKEAKVKAKKEADEKAAADKKETENTDK